MGKYRNIFALLLISYRWRGFIGRIWSGLQVEMRERQMGRVCEYLLRKNQETQSKCKLRSYWISRSNWGASRRRGRWFNRSSCFLAEPP